MDIRAKNALTNNNLQDIATQWLDYIDNCTLRYRKFIISYIYDFVFPTNRKQWKLLNGYNYMQRKRTFYFLLRGAPRSNNWIHDLHEQLHYQSIRYYSCSAVDRTDLYTTLYDLLTQQATLCRLSVCLLRID